jgi:hypothetical protein
MHFIIKANHCGFVVWCMTGVFPPVNATFETAKPLPAELPNLTNPIITIIYPEILAHQITHPHPS